MRKFYLLLVVSFLCLSHSSAQVRPGVKCGWDLMEFSLEGNVQNKLSAYNTYGFFAGLMIDAKLPLLPLGIDVSVLYNQKELKFNEMTEKAKFIVVPLNAKFSFGLGSVLGVFLTTGPQMTFDLYNEDLFLQLTDLESSAACFKLSESQLSWNFGAGVKLLGHFQIGYTYNISLGCLGEFDYADALHQAVKGELNNKYHQLSLAYLF